MLEICGTNNLESRSEVVAGEEGVLREVFFKSGVSQPQGLERQSRQSMPDLDLLILTILYMLHEPSALSASSVSYLIAMVGVGIQVVAVDVSKRIPQGPEQAGWNVRR